MFKVQKSQTPDSVRQDRLADPMGAVKHESSSYETPGGALISQRQLAVDQRPQVVAQRRLSDLLNQSPVQRIENNTGMPDTLKSNLESMSGMDMSPVRVHYNSAKPAQLNAHAFAQGTNIHLAPGQNKHLPHEAWHVVQQMQGRVKPTTSSNGVAINDDNRLEREADTMGAKALQMKASSSVTRQQSNPIGNAVQRKCPKCGAIGDCKHKKKENLIGNTPHQLKYRQLPSSTVVQREACGDSGIEWYSGTRAQVTTGLAAQSGPPGNRMDITTDLAHILCCSFCESMMETWVNGGRLVGDRLLRFTTLFEPLVHQYNAQTAVAGGGNRNVYTEEAYWVPQNPANFAAATGLGVQNAYLVDQAFVNAVAGVLAPPFNAAAAGAYPAGLPPAQQGEFDDFRNEPAAAGAAPAAVNQRSYATAQIRNSGTYQTLRWLSRAPGGGAGTAWSQLKRLSGRMRILDFAGDRTPAGGAPRTTVADAKFSYMAGGFDDWGPGQAADQQTIYQSITGGAGPGNAVPQVTFDTCQCNQELFRTMSADKERRDKKRAKGKRRSKDFKQRAGEKRKMTDSAIRGIRTATKS